ncbi:hypothetical protein ABZ921_07575 [Streptomyces atriruber]|uniref:DNA primase/polymerase bifunctional N-terminal domain-containing protein n=1 Tax=Streptomyces atriruber TaxID=545121 RepID=A0ABV3BHI1_9ACTN
MTIPRQQSAVFDWLARAQAAPHQAHREWAERGIALLPLGTRFNAVHLPTRLVHRATGTEDPDIVTATLAELLNGPVIHNRPQHQYYALVERTPTMRWMQEYGEAPMLGTGHFLSVPASDLTGPTGLYWAVRPRIVGDLCPVQSVAALIRIARSELQRGRR